MTHLYLIRHADSLEGLEAGKYRDLGLSPNGTRQAEQLRERLVRTSEIAPDVLICSAARRAVETARILEPAFKQTFMLEPDFEEWRGDDGTLSPEEFSARWEMVPKAQKSYFRWMEGYENRLEFALRVQLTLNRVLQAHAEKTIIVITHGALIQMTFQFFFGYGAASFDRAVPEIRKTSITHWFKPQQADYWILERSNDYAHLA